MGTHDVPDGRRDLRNGDVVHATMMHHATYGFMTRPAGQIVRGFHDGSQGIEGSPMPRTGWPENAYAWRSQRRRDVQQARVIGYDGVCSFESQNGITQVGAG